MQVLISDGSDLQCLERKSSKTFTLNQDRNLIFAKTGALLGGNSTGSESCRDAEQLPSSVDGYFPCCYVQSKCSQFGSRKLHYFCYVRTVLRYLNGYKISDSTPSKSCYVLIFYLKFLWWKLLIQTLQGNEKCEYQKIFSHFLKHIKLPMVIILLKCPMGL